eukprot:2797006-Rhodomonas_salina.3
MGVQQQIPKGLRHWRQRLLTSARHDTHSRAACRCQSQRMELLQTRADFENRLRIGAQTLAKQVRSRAKQQTIERAREQECERT